MDGRKRRFLNAVMTYIIQCLSSACPEWDRILFVLAFSCRVDRRARFELDTSGGEKETNSLYTKLSDM